MSDLDLSLLKRLYGMMVKIRVAEERIADLVDQKAVHCPCHLYIGQEAIAAGVCAALETADYVWGGHRSHGHYLAKGGSLNAMIAEIFGKTTGCSEGRGGSMHLLAPDVGILGTVPLVAATIPLAVGAALAARLRGEPRVSVSFFGDGATEEGHFHESVNLAAVYRLPVLFVCENNYYASHMSLLERRAQDNIVKTADAHGIAGVRLDGNDVVAVYHAAVEAAARARRGDGPTLIECDTYRWRGHVGASYDMDVGVLRKDELAQWKPKDPIPRLGRLLIDRGVPEAELDRIAAELQAEVDRAVRFAQESPNPPASDLFEHVFVGKAGV